ncbi:MAG: BrnT family toxin [Chthoniobacterales bacterium]|nr:BrnT family toxin [Chthoniobacterales bacterium]
MHSGSGSLGTVTRHSPAGPDALREHLESIILEQAFFIEPFVVVPDDRHSADERRWQALGQTGRGRSLFLVFAIRGTMIRVIAARDMNRKERNAYGEIKARIEKDSEVQE